MRVHRVLRGPIVAVTALLVSALASDGVEAQSPYHILLTNDDGVESPGIQALARSLASIGEVTLIAPCSERSGSSMSVLLGEVVRMRSVEGSEGFVGYCVDSTPAGAVLFGVRTLAPEAGFDLVVSGINRGANVGDLAHMSGTVGAAMMGAYLGIPAVAASLDSGTRDFEDAARFVARFVGQIRTRSLPPGLVLSVNIPAANDEGIRGVRVAEMGGSYMTFAYEEGPPEDGVRVFRPRIGLSDDQPAGSDTEAYQDGYITVTPLGFDWTARDWIETVRSWNLGLGGEGGPGAGP